LGSRAYEDTYTNAIKEEINLLNEQLVIISEKVEEGLCLKDDIRHHTEIYIHDMQISIDDVTPVTNHCLELAEKKMNESFRGW